MTVQEATEFAKIHLPQSAKNVKVHGERGIDQLVLITFSLPAREKNRFVKSSKLPTPKENRNPIQKGFGKQLGWRLDELEHYEGAVDQGRPIRQYVIDTANPKTVTVYLAAFNT